MAILKILNGSMASQTRRLTNQPLILGRDSNSGVVLSNPRVSRSHAKLYSSYDKFYIEDLGSRNGTFVNGTRVEGAAPLTDRDWIEVGDTIFEFSDEGRVASFGVPDIRSIRGQQGGGREQAIERPTAEYAPSYDSVCAQASPQVKLQAVLQITRDLGTCLDSEDIFQRTLDCAARIFPQAASVEILQTDQFTGRLIPITGSKLPSEDDSTIISAPGLKAAVTQAIESGTAVVGDTGDDSKDVSRTAWHLCAPLTAPSGDIFGVIHLEFRGECTSYMSEDQEILTCIAILAAQSLAHVRAHDERYRAVVDTSAQAILTFNDRGVIE
jgi:hypothetical protein